MDKEGFYCTFCGKLKYCNNIGRVWGESTQFIHRPITVQWTRKRAFMSSSQTPLSRERCGHSQGQIDPPAAGGDERWWREGLQRVDLVHHSHFSSIIHTRVLVWWRGWPGNECYSTKEYVKPRLNKPIRLTHPFSFISSIFILLFILFIHSLWIYPEDCVKQDSHFFLFKFSPLDTTTIFV